MDMKQQFEAWFRRKYIDAGFVSSKGELEEAYQAGAKAEREACAGLCDDVSGRGFKANKEERSDMAFGMGNAAEFLAAAIRARDTTQGEGNGEPEA